MMTRRRRVIAGAIAGFAITLPTGCRPKSTTGEVSESSRTATPPVAIADSDALSLVELANQAARRGDWSVAERRLQRRLIANPRDLTAGRLLADVQVAAGRADEAIVWLEELSEQNPYDIATRRQLAALLNDRGYRFSGNEHLRRIAQTSPMRIEELIAIALPVNTFTPFSEKPDATDPAQRAARGVLSIVAALRQNGEVAAALRGLRESKLLRSDAPPQRRAEANAMLGWLIADTGEMDELRRWTAAAGPMERRFPAYWMATGSLALTDRTRAAAGGFRQAILREPALLPAWDGLLAAGRSVGDPDETAAAQNGRKNAAEVQHLIRQWPLDKPASVDPQLARRLGELLNRCGRLIESLAWQELAASPSSRRLLANYKPEVLRRFPRGVATSVLLAGIPAESTDETLNWLATVTPPAQPTYPLSAARSAKPPAPPVFVDVADSVGIHFLHQNAPTPVHKEFRLFEALGAGVACLDYDRDGSVDLYFGQSATGPAAGQSNRLFRGNGSQFVDRTHRSGTGAEIGTTGVTAGDWNQDGFEDLLIGHLGVNQLLINQGDGTFRSQSLGERWDDGQMTMSVAIGDLNGDGLPEIVEANYVDDPRALEPIARDERGEPLTLPGPLHFKPAVGRIFVSQGDGNVNMRRLGDNASTSPASSLGLLITNLDGRPGNELFVANDQRPNHLWRLQSGEPGGELSASESAIPSGVAFGPGGKPTACMGIAAADFDGDGQLDLHITNFTAESNHLFRQTSAGQFQDAAVGFAIDAASLELLGFGTQAIDYDNNGQPDLIVGNGHIEDFRSLGRPFRMPTQLLAGLGNRFEEQPVAGDDVYWRTGHLSRAVASCDFDSDGRTDVVVTGLNEPARLLHNRTATDHHFVQIQLVGRTSERDAIGSHVIVTAGGQTWHQWVQTGDGYLARNQPLLHFGLGDAERIDSIHVRWPSGDQQIFKDLPTQKNLLMVEDQQEVWIQTSD